MAKQKSNAVWLYWGYLPFAGALLGWLNPQIGPAVIAVLAGVSVFYFFFQVPRPCRAWKRQKGERCRNNAQGLLRGCWIQEHKWQNLWMLVNYQRWRELGSNLWAGWSNAVPTLANSVAVVSGLVAMLAHFVTSG